MLSFYYVLSTVPSAGDLEINRIVLTSRVLGRKEKYRSDRNTVIGSVLLES